MTENLDKFPAITNLSKKEKKVLNDNLVKFHIISNVLDCLAIHKFLEGKENVSYKTIMNWLDKRATAAYDEAFCARIELWIHEMIWLDLISCDEQKQELSFTENGYKAYKNQQFHLAYANLLEAKGSRNLARAAFWIGVVAVLISIIPILYNAIIAK